VKRLGFLVAQQRKGERKSRQNPSFIDKPAVSTAGRFPTPRAYTSVFASTKRQRLNGTSDEGRVLSAFSHGGHAASVRRGPWRHATPEEVRAEAPIAKNTAVAWRRQRRDAGDPNKKAPYADEYSTPTDSETSTVVQRGARLRRLNASR
jgi:hypothetical protein